MICRYVDRLIEEISFRSEISGRLNADTVYFGGGTPSLLDASDFEKIIKGLNSAFSLSGDTEITVEMNPHDLNRQKLLDLNSLGINRIVLGVQTLNEKMHNILGRSGRLCTPADLDLFFSTGEFTRCIDIIGGLPGQREENLLSDLKQVLPFLPEHISLYLLSVEEGTPLARRFSPDETFEDNQRNLWESAMDFLVSKGYEHYEISNFCRPGCQSRHNMKYWSFAPYAGLGAGAHSFLDSRRFSSRSSVQNYLESSSFSYEYDDRGDNALIVEYLMTALRLTRGFTLSGLRAVTGRDLPSVSASRMEDMISQGMIIIEGDRILLTRQGLFYADALIYRLTEPLL